MQFFTFAYSPIFVVVVAFVEYRAAATLEPSGKIVRRDGLENQNEDLCLRVDKPKQCLIDGETDEEHVITDKQAKMWKVNF